MAGDKEINSFMMLLEDATINHASTLGLALFAAEGSKSRVSAFRSLQRDACWGHEILVNRQEYCNCYLKYSSGYMQVFQSWKARRAKTP